MTETLYTQYEVAAILKISFETLRKWRYAGKVKGIRLGHRSIRIPESELARLIREGARA